MDVALASFSLWALTVATRVDLDPCTAAWVDQKSLRAALELELGSIRTPETKTSTLAIGCTSDEEGVALSLDGQRQSIRLRSVPDDQRARVLALAAVELMHAMETTPTRTASTSPVIAELQERETIAVARPSPWALSLRTELLSTLPPSAAAIGLSLVAEQPARSLAGALSSRGAIVLHGIDSGRRVLLAAGARAGVGVPLAAIGGAELEGEATLGGGLLHDPSTGYGAYGEARLALVLHVPLSDALELPLSIAIAALQPGGFAIGIAGGLGAFL